MIFLKFLFYKLNATTINFSKTKSSHYSVEILIQLFMEIIKQNKKDFLKYHNKLITLFTTN